MQMTWILQLHLSAAQLRPVPLQGPVQQVCLQACQFTPSEHTF